MAKSFTIPTAPGRAATKIAQKMTRADILDLCNILLSWEQKSLLKEELDTPKPRPPVDDIRNFWIR